MNQQTLIILLAAAGGFYLYDKSRKDAAAADAKQKQIIAAMQAQGNAFAQNSQGRPATGGSSGWNMNNVVSTGQQLLNMGSQVKDLWNQGKDLIGGGKVANPAFSGQAMGNNAALYV